MGKFAEYFSKFTIVITLVLAIVLILLGYMLLVKPKVLMKFLRLLLGVGSLAAAVDLILCLLVGLIKFNKIKYNRRDNN